VLDLVVINTNETAGDFVTSGFSVPTFLSCSFEIFDCTGEIVGKLDTLDISVDSHNSSEDFNGFDTTLGFVVKR